MMGGGRYFLKVNGQRLPADVEAAANYFEYESNDELLDRVLLRFKSADGRLLDSYFPQGADLEFVFGQDNENMSEPRVFTIRRVEGTKAVQVIAYEPGSALMTHSRSKVYRNITIDELGAQKARENGLQFQGDTFPLRYPQLAQVNESDIRFLKRQAQRVNALVQVDKQNRTLYMLQRSYQGAAVAEFIIDDDGGFAKGKAIAFRPVETSLGLTWEVTVAGLDPMTLQPFEARANDKTVRRTVLGSDTILFDGAIGAAARTGQTGVRQYTASGSAIQAKQEAESLFKSQEAGMVKASVQLWGNAAVLTNKIIKLTGRIERWAGLYRVKKARHIIESGPYKILAEIERNATGAPSGGRKTGGTANR